MHKSAVTIQTINIISVFGVQIGLWIFYPWWIALLSLPMAVLVAAGLALSLMPVTTKIINSPLWEYYKSISPALFFGLGQFLSALLLALIFI